MTSESKHVIRRACHAHCGLVIDFEDGVPVSTHGDKDNPAFQGYSCIKGRELANYHSLESRLHSSLKRQADGTYADIRWTEAAAEISEKVAEIIAEHGPDSVALYVGTFGYNNIASHAFGIAFMEAIESKMYCTSVTIDQPGKGISLAHHGSWLAGGYRRAEWDGLVLIGNNPVISHNGGLGTNPGRQLYLARKRGMDLIVIDPRKTDVAAKADLHLQCRPGEDPGILAAIARQILEDRAEDAAFLAENVDGLEDLRRAVAPYTPDSVAARAGVPAEDIVRAARMIGAWKKGHIHAGTGPNMSGFGNVVEYLVLAIQTLKGFWRREGEVRRNAGFFIQPTPSLAAAVPPFPARGFGKKIRTRGLEETTLGIPTAAMSEEILTPGEGQVKALFVLGGNPVQAWPDQAKALAAMRELDLLVCFDPRMSKTAEQAHYVIAPKLHYEIHGTTAPTEMFGGFGAGWGFEETYGQASKPILDVPEGSDLCEEFEFFQTVATHLDKSLSIKSWALINDPVAADAERTVFEPGATISPVDAWSATLRGAPVAVADAFESEAIQKGTVLETPALTVQAKPDDWEGRLDVGAEHMMNELDRYRRERLTQDPAADTAVYPFRLISRRLNDIHNSNWHEVAGLRKRIKHHPAYINPSDLEALNIADGDVIEIESAVARITCVAQAAPDVRAGCLSVPHSWGTLPDEADDPLGAGGNTGRLSAANEGFDPISGIPIMSAIPVKLRPLRGGGAA